MTYIMFITENNEIARSLGALLGKEFMVDIVHPQGAVRAVAERRPSALLLDSPLGSMNSFELLAKLLQYDPGLTVVKIVSGSDKSIRDSMDSGAFDVIGKPLDAQKALHVINRAVERDKLLRANELLKREGGPAEPERKIYDNGHQELFFHDLFQAIAENFPHSERISIEVLKIIKRQFFFNRMLFLLEQKGSFNTCAALGIEEKVVKEIRVSCSHPLLIWLTGRSRILNMPGEKEVPFECREFMDILNCRLAFPLKTVDGRLIGVFLAGGKITGGETTFKEISFLSTVIDYLATVFDSSMLYRETSFRKEFQEAIFKNMPAGVISVDAEGKVMLFNDYAETIFGMKSEELRDKPVEKIGSQMADFVRRALSSGEAFNRVEVDYVPGKMLLGLSVNPVKDEKGEIKGAVSIFQNLTFVKELERKEKDAERNRYWTAVASRLSHELKNPLVAIKTFAQMLPLKYEDEEFRTKFSEIMQAEVQRINEIIEKINKLADSMELKTMQVDIVGLFSGKALSICKNGGPDFNFEGYKRIFASGDPDKLEEAMGYIVDFVREDTGGSGSADICFKEKDGFVEIMINEKGDKIKLRNSEDLFVPFNASIRSPVSIGVVLARKIMELHGGGFRCVLGPGEKKLIVTLPVNLKNEQDSYC